MRRDPDPDDIGAVLAITLALLIVIMAVTVVLSIR